MPDNAGRRRTGPEPSTVAARGTRADAGSPFTATGASAVTAGALDTAGVLDAAGILVIAGIIDVADIGDVAGFVDVVGFIDAVGLLDIAGFVRAAGFVDVPGFDDVAGPVDVAASIDVAGLIDAAGNLDIAGIIDVPDFAAVAGFVDVDVAGFVDVAASFDVVGVAGFVVAVGLFVVAASIDVAGVIGAAVLLDVADLVAPEAAFSDGSAAVLLGTSSTRCGIRAGTEIENAFGDNRADGVRAPCPADEVADPSGEAIASSAAFGAAMLGIPIIVCFVIGAVSTRFARSETAASLAGEPTGCALPTPATSANDGASTWVPSSHSSASSLGVRSFRASAATARAIKICSKTRTLVRVRRRTPICMPG